MVPVYPLGPVDTTLYRPRLSVVTIYHLPDLLDHIHCCTIVIDSRTFTGYGWAVTLLRGYADPGYVTRCGWPGVTTATFTDHYQPSGCQPRTFTFGYVALLDHPGYSHVDTLLRYRGSRWCNSRTFTFTLIY